MPHFHLYRKYPTYFLDPNYRKMLIRSKSPSNLFLNLKNPFFFAALLISLSCFCFFLRRFKTSNIQSGVTKGVPDFCTVYVISKGKVSSVRNACRPPPYLSPLLDHIQRLSNKKNFNASDPHAKRRGLFINSSSNF